VHCAEDEQYDADLSAFELDYAAEVLERVFGLEGEGNIADVDEVEADNEELVDGVGERGIAVESVQQEDAAAAVEGAGDPDGDGDADGEVA
jgi:hypothetical protein